MPRHVAEAHAADLAPGDVETIVEQTVFGQLQRMHFDHAEHRAALDRQHRMRDRTARAADRFMSAVGGVDDAVFDRHPNRIAADFVLLQLDRSDDAVLDPHPRLELLQFKTRFGGTIGFAVAVDPPARHQRAVADQQFRGAVRRVLAIGRWFARCRHVQRPPGDDHAVQRESTADIEFDRERIGQIGLPVHQADHRAHAVRRTQSERLPRAQPDVQRLHPHAAVDQFDHRMRWRIVAPLAQGVGDPRHRLRRIGVRFADPIQREVLGRAQHRTQIFSAANVGGETIAIADAHAFLRQLRRREHQSPQHRIDRDLAALGFIAPAGEVGDDQRGRRQRLRGIVTGPLLGPDRETGVFAVQIALPRFQRGFHDAAADRYRQIRFFCDVAGAGLRLRATIQRRVLAQHAEGETVRADVFGAVCRRARDRITAHPPDEHAHIRNVVAVLIVVADVSRIRAADVDAVRNPIERRIHAIQRPHVAQRRGAQTIEMRVVQLLRAIEQLEELDRARRPAGDIARQVFEQRERAFATTVADEIGDFPARHQHPVQCASIGTQRLRRRARRRRRTEAEQIGDIRHRPVVGGLDEPVVVQMRDIVFDHIHLFGDRAQQRLQRIAVFGVADAVDRRQIAVQAVDAWVWWCRQSDHGCARWVRWCGRVFK